jgi:hypothetical protein
MRNAAVVLSLALAACMPPMPPKEPLVQMPQRTETVETETAIDGLAIAARPYGAAGWTVNVKNDTDAMASIVWDESAFVSPRGQSGGRLIRGDTRRVDLAKSQPATPIPPGAATEEVVFIEKIVEVERTESEYAEADAKWGGVSPDMNRVIQKSRRDIRRSIAGGALNVTIQLADGKQTWTGRVSGGQAKAAPDGESTSE